MYMKEQCAAAGDDDAISSRRISDYKHETLPILGYLEDVDKLDVIMV